MRVPPKVNSFLRSRFFLILCASVFFALAFLISGKEKADHTSDVVRFENTLSKKAEHAKVELSELSGKTKIWNYKKLFSEKHGYYESLFEREGLVFLIFEDDSLRFWTDNTVSVDNLLSRNNFKDNIVKLPNGWFEVVKLQAGKKELYALILLKREYAYPNKYLANEFQREFSLDPEVVLEINTQKVAANQKEVAKDGSTDIYDAEGACLFTLIFPPISSINLLAFYFIVLLNILGLIFSIGALHIGFDSLSDKISKGWSALLLILSIIVFRYFIISIRFPHVFYQTKLFSPELYGDASYPFLGSLGDLLINVLLVFYLVFFICPKFNSDDIKSLIPRSDITNKSVDLTSSSYTDKFKGSEQNSITLQWLLSLVLLLIIFFVSRIINYIFVGLISNSNIPFTINDVFSQNIYTYVCLLIISLFFISYFLLLDKVIEVIRSFGLKKSHLIIISAVSIALFVTASHLLGTVDTILVFWPVLLFILLIVIKQKWTLYSFSTIAVFLFIVSFFSAHVILKFTNSKERDSRTVFAQKLSAEQDPLAEHLFAEVKDKVCSDTSLINLLSHPDYMGKSPITIPSSKREGFTKKLLSKYFSGYWEKYEIRISVFDTTCLPLVQGSLPDRYNLSYFEEVISSNSIPTESKNFFYLTNSTGRISYLAHILLMQSANGTIPPYRVADLFIEFDSRIVSDEMGFPELMLDRKLGIVQELLDYSYAKYKDGKLISYHGKFPYSLSSESFLKGDLKGNSFPYTSFSDIDGYNHLSYVARKDSLVVISKKDDGKIAVVTTFSYLFAFFSLMLLLLLLLRILIFERNIRLNSFRSRIQFVLVSMVLFSLLFFGVGTTFYINQQYDKQTRQSVRDKMVSALVECTQELGSESELKVSKSDFFSYVLKRMSNIFMTDISLYDKAGNLIGTSQMKLFDEGLMSRKMCPESYYRLAIQQNIEFIHDEKIGNLDYLSAYCSFRNDEGVLIGYLNIPYFARQSELEKEISTILAAIINIYVLLFVISVILALAISEYFTKPLKLIQEKLSKIKLGKASEPIEWKSQDEIGSLVNEYNRMIDELQRSAELLAKSERETAWREMAKQVAHEIKNPLTPMKLSIQHLQRTWKNKGDDMNKKIERITATMIEQIETLSNIASQFSNFAKMPTSASEKINLKNILENCIILFKDSTDTEFSFDCSLEEAFIYADKEQMLRVCNNLLKNALQAIPKNQQGEINISLTKKDKFFIIKIKDNGTGIEEDKWSKIFTPNFTTKTAGMGLGLAMVKNIVETFGGKIWFETTHETGTSFYVSLLEYREKFFF
jgi:two-component system, NtrC family, nitrogen regulation sensor histidine kinase NtrY